MEIIKSATCSIKIYIAGPIEIAKQFLRKYCLRGFCCSIQEIDYIYTAGEESGYVIILENYSFYPKSDQQLLQIAEEICKGLILETHQSSAMIVTSNETFVVSRRKEIPLSLD